jgi:transaldolase
LRDLATGGAPPEGAARLLTVDAVRWACPRCCDVLREVYEFDRRMSIEVDPRVADDTAKTVA